MANGFQRIPAPAAAPPRVGLITSAQTPDLGGARWQDGIVFHPQASLGTDALDGGAWWDGCDAGLPSPPYIDPLDAEPGTKTTGPAELADVQYLPWVNVEAKEAPVTSFSEAEYQAIARQRLVANETTKVEREFWAGEVAQAGGLPNHYLTEAATPVLGEYPLAYALARLQQYLADAIPGRGMVHCSTFTAALWHSAGMVRREGNLLLDLADNLIVPGGGYDGSGPEGQTAAVPQVTEYAYATGMVQFLHDDIIFPSTYAEAIDRNRNRVTLRAERLVAAFHDQQAQAAVLVDLTNPCGS